jgi:hypothetical protein
VPSGASGDMTTVLTAGDQTYCTQAMAPHAKDVANRVIQTSHQSPPTACAAP